MQRVTRPAHPNKLREAEVELANGATVGQVTCPFRLLRGVG